MPSATIPKAGDLGILYGAGTAMIPVSVPPSYIPAAGEAGLAAGDLFLPIEPLYSAPKADDEPLFCYDQAISREPPFYDQVDMRVALPCVAPYNWNQTTANRTLILDTLPDALCGTDEKATPGYVANPGLTLSSKTHADFNAASYDDGTGVGYRWHYGTAPGTPQPALRAGQTRYSGYGTAASGTEYAGTAFVPGDAGSFVSGTLNIQAYRYGLLLSGTSKWPVSVKLGKATASWDQGDQQLTLATPTSGGSFYYGTNGTADNFYPGPLTFGTTATITWHGTRAGLVASDTWTTSVTYDGSNAPADFTETKYSTLPAFSNTPVPVAVKFQRRPDWYISPNGTGAGTSADCPSNATAVIGTVQSAGSATAGQLIWASEGTYTNPSGTASNYFYNANAIIVRGGYSSDFTERDVMARRTIFKAVSWGTSKTTSANCNIRSLALAGTADGVWADTETIFYKSGGDLWLYASELFYCRAMYNCHVDLSLSLQGADDSTTLRITSPDLGGGFYEWVYCKMWTVGAGVFWSRNCTFKVSVEIGDSSGTGSVAAQVTCGYTPYGRSPTATAFHNCDVETLMSVGNATGGSVVARCVGDYCMIGGRQSFTAITGSASSSSPNVAECIGMCIIGGGAVLSHQPTSGTGGSSQALSTAYINVALTETGGTWLSLIPGVSYRSRPTSANAASSNAASSNAITRALSKYSSPRGFPANVTIDSVTSSGDAGADSSSYLQYLGANSYNLKITGSASCGTASNSRAYLNMIGMDGATPITPAFFRDGDIDFIEGAPYGPGNPIRVNHSTNSTVGWYSGMDNGDGAPLKGYETPQGTGVALGRYWE